MRKQIAAATVFLLLFSSLGFFAYVSDQHDLDNGPKIAPNTVHRIQGRTTRGEDPRFNRELAEAIAKANVDLPNMVAQPGRHPGKPNPAQPKPAPTAKPNPAKPNPATAYWKWGWKRDVDTTDPKALNPATNPYLAKFEDRLIIEGFKDPACGARVRIVATKVD